MNRDTDISKDATKDEERGVTSPSSEPPGRIRRLLVILVLLGIAAGVLFVNFREQIMEDYERWQALKAYDLGPESPPDIVVFREGDKTLLWATRDGHHFDISEFRLDSSQLSRAYGRDYYPPLLKPTYVSIEAAKKSDWVEPSTWSLVVKTDEGVRIYPFPLFYVVNEVVNGTPVAVIDSFVLERQIGDVTLTFAHSGYTSFMDEESGYRRTADLLWDLETESLWSPLKGKSVAGPCIDIPLSIFDPTLWAQMMWQDAIVQFPDALVLDPALASPEPFDIKTKSDPPWPSLNPPDVQRLSSDESGPIAPDWTQKTSFQ